MMRRILAGGSAGVVSLAVLALSIAAQQPNKLPKNDAAELKKLQQERLTTLTQLVKTLEMRYEAGAVDFVKLADARTELFNAQLELADTLSARIALIETQVKTAEEVLKFTESCFEQGFRVNQIDVYRAKLAYLDIKIKLLLERAKSKAAAKADSL
jgi:outer membrane protein TolC